MENEFVWKVDFKTKREQAEAAAQPHWQRRRPEQSGRRLESEAKDLRKSLVGTTDAAYRENRPNCRPACSLNRCACKRDAQAAGDRLYWPIFNLDQNPNAPEEETHDPDVLL